MLDDPISSFDSIYKNKIAYCIIKFLDRKEQIILTHNTDLICLLEVQLNDCFNLYILNNVNNGHNGFVEVNSQEKALLINFHKLVRFLQNKNNGNNEHLLFSAINNRKQFFMAIIPFLRGYAHVSLDPDDYAKLSNIMHGYGTGKIDIVSIYKNFLVMILNNQR